MTEVGTDCCICKPNPFLLGYQSFNLKRPGVCYKVTLCICTGDIVGIHNLFSCSQWPELKMFWHALIGEKETRTKVKADIFKEDFLMNGESTSSNEKG